MTKLEMLKANLLRSGRSGLCVAFSGGVDSALVLKAAAMVLGEKAAAVTFSSRLSPKSEPESAKKLAAGFGVRHYTLNIDEFEDEKIINNPPERCYLCKKYIFKKLLAFSAENSLGRVADGTNLDDLHQFRPGLRALRELNILSPLAECGFRKQDVRDLAFKLGIEVSDKPSAPCLATRIPYGVKLSDELLSRVDAAETYLKSLGFKICRVRAYDTLARIEVEPHEFGIFLMERDEIACRFKELGFTYITLDAQGFRSGSMDEILNFDIDLWKKGFSADGIKEPARKIISKSETPKGTPEKRDAAGTDKPMINTAEPPYNKTARNITYLSSERKHGSLDIKALLEDVKSGSVSIDDAARQLMRMPYDDLGFARVDHHRESRQGFPEVIFCQGKKPDQIAKIARNISLAGENVLASRADKIAFDAIRALLPQAVYHEDARIVEAVMHDVEKKGLVAVCTAGTADIPIAEEAAVTAEAFGCNVTRIFDVGVAGIHRLFDRLDEIRSANVVVAVAGMEGALASVIGGLVDKPCVAVPTSVGYGASFGGLSALLTMLNSCAAGVGVVNIDNGFGAGVLAAQINRLATAGPQSK